ncbi:hypothetical protein ACQKNB_00975 [Lysinibacillus xylanilyticus]|uniref:hypothetical protein n=1 Tax=Lysinibacillus xylanilyticus TaxID=582475 RepID=UPI003D01FCDB
MSLQGKRITKKQAQILENLFASFDAIHDFVNEHGEKDLDLTDDTATILCSAEDLYLAFGKADKKYCSL